MATAAAGQYRIFQHKFQPPASGLKGVFRSNLIQRVKDNPDISCVIVQAPPGHGKTTLLSQLAEDSRATGHQTGWLTLEEADNDLYRLIAHLDRIIGSIEESLEPVKIIEAGTEALPRGLAERLNNRLMEIGKPIHLFFDDFHTIEQSEIEDFFCDVLRRLTPPIKIFIGSRSIPRLDISNLQVSQRILLLRYDELKFSLDEAREFFEQEQKLELTEEELGTIYDRSEGWPAALQLFRLTLSKKPVKDSLTNLESYTPFQLTEYLASNVLQSQSEDVRDFLLKCSLLPKLNASLCEAVTGRQDAQELLLFLDQSGLFLNNIDHESFWFQFHGLFANYLQSLYKKKAPANAKAIHLKAARWFLEQKIYEECIYHAIEAQEFSLATQAMDVWASEQIANACLHSVERWAEKIPFDAMSQCPSLAVKVTWALTFLRRRKKLHPYLEILRNIDDELVDKQFQIERQITVAVVELALDNLETALSAVEGIDTDDRQATDFWAFELGAAANMQAFRSIALGNFAEARFYIAVGRNHSQEGNAPFPLGYNTGLTIISCYLQGRVSEAYDRSLVALKAKSLNIEESFAAAAAVSNTLVPMYEHNEIDAAKSVFEHYREDIDTGLLLDFVAIAYLPMIRIYDACGEHSKTEKLLETLEDIALSANWPRLLDFCQWENVRRALMHGDISSARELANRILSKKSSGRDSTLMTFADAIEDPALSQLRLKAHIDDDPQLEKILQEEIIDARNHNRVPREIKLRLITAVFNKRNNQPQQSQQELKNALTIAQEYGFLRTVIDEGPEVISLLQESRNHQWPVSMVRYVNKLLALTAGEHGDDSQGTAPKPVEELTARELQMLIMLAKGESNKAIGRQLFVSENTVKFHLKNIYHKLQVKTRTQAISTAIAMGLI